MNARPPRRLPPLSRAALLVLVFLAISAGIFVSANEKLELLGAGASFPAAFYQDAIFAYQFVEPTVTLSYLPTGSSKGKCRVKDFDATCSSSDDLGSEYIDFAGSDSLLTAAEYQAYPDLQMLPTVAGSIVPVVNIPILDSEAGEILVVDRSVLSRIFMGLIIRWNDPEILAQQSPSVADKLAAAENSIKLVVRGDGSGSTEVFTKALNLFSDGDFAAIVGEPSSNRAVWDGAINRGANVSFHDGTSALSGAVLLTEWTIGYAAGDAAEAAGLQVAAFRQNSKQTIPVTYGTESVSFAMLEKGLQFGNNGDDSERMTADLMDARGGLAWPISTYTYVIFRNGIGGDRLRPGATCEHVMESLKFWYWLYTSDTASQLAARKSFVGLPQLVRAPIISALRKFKCGGVELFQNYGDRDEQAVTVKGTVDGLADYVADLFALSFQAVFEWARITYAKVTAGHLIDISDPLVDSEGFQVVVGNEIYGNAWMKRELAKVLTARGTPTDTSWSDLHGAGESSTMALPWFAFSIEFYANIQGKVGGLPLVVSKQTLGLILDGGITAWNDPRLAADNTWLAELQASEADLAIKLFASHDSDSVYTILSSELSSGFKAYSSSQKFHSYNQAAIVASGVPGAFLYTTSMSSTPSSLTPLALKWPRAPSAVEPSRESGLACVTHPDAFDPATQALIVDEAVPGCYPLLQPVNMIFHHSYADDEEMCHGNSGEDETDYGTGLTATRFVKWLFESGQATEGALSNNGAIPLTHATGNEAHIAAVLHITETINCGHAPDLEVFDWTIIIIACSVGGAAALCVLGLAYYTISSRNEMKSNPLKGLNVLAEMRDVMEDVRPIEEGAVATYIPELGLVPPDLFAIAIVTTKGKVYKLGDFESTFSIQSMVKPFSYAHALDQNGVEFMKTKVGVEPAGGAFDAIEMNPDGLPFNPYINAGAIAVTMQLEGDTDERYNAFRKFLSSYGSRELKCDDSIYKSESSTAARNREIAEVLQRNGVCASDFDKEHGLEAYFKQCSTLVNTVDLAMMAATCANGGTNPITKQQVVPSEINEEVMSVMMTCGMYNGAGNWMVDVGIPAKSGVSGGIFGVVPGVCGVAVFSPRLNEAFNSVRGIYAFRELSQRMGLHVLQKSKGGVSVLAPFVGRKSRMRGSQGSTIAKSFLAPAPKKARVADNMVTPGDMQAKSHGREQASPRVMASRPAEVTRVQAWQVEEV
mmetsp:Transcript_10648/g.27388  ORF Transcript_10648/g.27388 Transcript_10648/m.27388 type:complete len:1216 (+) Transcript_10648:587-4234(+)